MYLMKLYNRIIDIFLMILKVVILKFCLKKIIAYFFNFFISGPVKSNIKNHEKTHFYVQFCHFIELKSKLEVPRKMKKTKMNERKEIN